MSLAPGTRLGHYEIVAPLGAGGMGEVYRAKDTRLKREVAVKVLPEAFARDAGRMARFQREAEVLAALNHLNIAQIYGAEEQALIMELVEGPTLAERIQQGAIPLAESLEIARQIAEALEAAHEKGIVHRDLKPANVKVKSDGAAKVLDFGLAAILQNTASDSTNPANSPTLTIGATQVGAIMGTAGYMSPEQAVGKPVDRRADIWSFGVVLYEMLTGERLFTGETTSHILADVIKGEIDFGNLPPSTPVAIRNLLKRCLDRDVKTRLQWIGEARVTISNAGKGQEASTPSRPGLENRGWIASAVLAIVAAIALWALWRETRPVEKPLVRLDVDLGPDISLPSPEVTVLSAVAISPDGTRIVYLASVSGGMPRLFTRRLDQPTAMELPGTTGASGQCFSLDGQWIGFYAGGKFNKISVEGGAVVPLTDVPGYPGGASWQEDGDIIVAGAISAGAGAGAGGLARISSGGGAPTMITDINGDLGHVFPQELPGRKAVLFVAYSKLSPEKASINVVTLADGHRKTIVREGTAARYVATSNRSGHLLYSKKGTLFAVPFDLDRLETRGTAVPILDDIEYQSLSGMAQFDVSRSGTLVYRKGRSGAVSGTTTIQWVVPGNSDARKKEPLRSKPDVYHSPRLSPDGKRLAVLVTEQGTQDVWVYDLQRDAMTRLTAGGGPYTQPVWSPNGRYVIFGTIASGMLWTRSDGAGEARPIIQTKGYRIPWSLTPDGKRLAYFQVNSTSGLWTVPLEEVSGEMKAGKPEPFLTSQSSDTVPALSPDGKWLAYVSKVTGSNEVYVRAFPDIGSRWQISNNGGTQPAWSRNGHELLYQSGDQIMAVNYAVKGDSFVAEKPRVWLSKLGGTQWDLAPDGKRMAVLTPVETGERPKQDHEIVFLENFFDELRRRVPLNK
jgi:serine/threonine protein kinase